MTNKDTNESVAAQFRASAAEIDAIFESFRDLYKIYIGYFKSIQNEANQLPRQFQSQIKNAKLAFESASKTVDAKQNEISNQLHAQGLVLLVGNAESLTREMFRTLFRNNVEKVKIKRRVELQLDQLFSATNDGKLGDFILEKLEEDKNPVEKLNFQNMQSLKTIMKSYFDMNIRDDLITELHKFWQIRHIVIHNSSLVDQHFLDNLKTVNIPTTKYNLNSHVLVTKADYDRCFELLVSLFENFDDEARRLHLIRPAG